MYIKSNKYKNIARAQLCSFLKMSEPLRLSEDERLQRYLDGRHADLPIQPKRKRTPGPGQPNTKKQSVTLPLDGPWYKQNAEEQQLVRDIKGCLAVIGEACLYLDDKQFPYEVTYAWPNKPQLCFIREKIRIDCLSKPKVQLLSETEPQHYCWEDLSVLLSKFPKNERTERLKSISQQIKGWSAKVGALHTACIALNTELDRLGLSNSTTGRIPVKKESCTIKIGHCSLALDVADISQGIPDEPYTQFALVLTKILGMFEPRNNSN